MRVFELWRELDYTGISGTGKVAEGVEFTDGKVCIHWCGERAHSTVVWDSLADAEDVHLHSGTRIEWGLTNVRKEA